MKKNIIATIILLVLDILWLKLFMGKKYNFLIKKIQNKPLRVNFVSAFLAYSFMVIALNLIVIKYNLNLLDTFIFGLCLYAVYDFTCGAVFKDWDFNLALIDILWGGFVYFVTILLTNKITNYL